MPHTSHGGQEWVHLDIARAIEQVGDEDALMEMLPMLQDLLERDLPQISQMLADHDVHGANQLLHGFKGTLPIFCARPLCEHVVQVELLSKKGESGEVSAAFAELKPKLDVLLLELLQYLKPSGGLA